MAVKRIYAADMHTALNKVRNQLGAEAVILATRQLADGVEVSAACGPGDADAKKPFTGDAGTQSTAPGNDWYADIAGVSDDRLTDESALHSELGSMCSLLQRWMDTQGWKDYATRSPVHAGLWERFRNLGLEPDLVTDLLAVADGSQDLKTSWQLALAELGNRIPVLGHDLIESGGNFALLGATGVGKTTTIGKLATRFVLEHGAGTVALVTTDRYRIAAHEQLRTLAKILGIEVHVVDEQNSLGAILRALSGRQLVFIDSAGISPSHPQFMRQLRQLQDLRAAVKPLLVLSATSQVTVQRSELAAYAACEPVAAIITKIDEATSLGGILGLLIESGLALAYSSGGQAIPEDISVANAQLLVRLAVQKSTRKSMAREEMITGFSSVLNQVAGAQQRTMSVD